MKYVDEFRDPRLIRQASDEIRCLADPSRHYRIMEVCGGHTHAIYRFGLADLLPPTSSWCTARGVRSACCRWAASTKGCRSWSSTRDLHNLRRRDARPGRSRKPARAPGARRRHPDGVFAARRAEARPRPSRAVRGVLRYRVRDDGAVDRPDAQTRSRARRQQLLGVLEPRHDRAGDPGHSRFTGHAA